jgi:hypothetical protein
MTIANLDDLLNRLTGTTTTEYSDDDKHTDLTRAAHEMVSEIADAQDDWDFQGEIGETDLKAVSSLSDREYSMPTDILKLKRIEADFDNDGKFTPVVIIDSSEQSKGLGSNDDIEDKFSNDKPYAELFDTGWRLYSGAISSDVTDGVKVWYAKEIVGTDNSGDDITSFSNDTDYPNIAEAFQIGLAYRAAQIFAQSKQRWNQAKDFESQYEKVIARMRRFYGNRSPDNREVVMGASQLENYN